MTVRPTSATVAIPNTAVADSSCLESCQWFDCNPGCVDSVESFRTAVCYAPTARAAKGLSTVKLAKVKEFSDRFQSWRYYTSLTVKLGIGHSIIDPSCLCGMHRD